MYAQDTACVLTQEGVSGTFACTSGVKQESPASLLLFGLYLDDLETLNCAQQPGNSQASQLSPPQPLIRVEDGASQVVPPLLFADNFCLTSLSMQKHMDALQAFCNDRGMQIDVGFLRRLHSVPQSSPVHMTYSGRGAGVSNPTLGKFGPVRGDVELSGSRSDQLWITFSAPSYRRTANEPGIDADALQRPLDLCGVCSHRADGQKHVSNPTPSAPPASPYWSSVTLKSPNEHQHALGGKLKALMAVLMGHRRNRTFPRLMGLRRELHLPKRQPS